MSRPVQDVRAYGARALLVEVADSAHAVELARWVRTEGPTCTDVVPAARTVLLDGVDDLAAAEHTVRGWAPTREASGVAGSQVTLGVRYDGADLALIAQHWDVDVDEVVRRHTSLEFVSAFCGFAPGFAYLSGLPPEWAVPRLSTPRHRVPVGSVALADRWCGVYPSPSPGGWLLLGTTHTPVWDLEGLTDDGSPALLAPGTRVRFEAL